MVWGGRRWRPAHLPSLESETLSGVAEQGSSAVVPGVAVVTASHQHRGPGTGGHTNIETQERNEDAVTRFCEVVTTVKVADINLSLGAQCAV